MIDKKHELEEKRVIKVKAIKDVNEEYEVEIDDLNETKNKYERKRQVNEEKKDEIEQEKLKLKEKELQVKARVEDFDAQIEGFNNLVSDMKSKIKKKERCVIKRLKMVGEFESKTQEYKDLVRNIAQCSTQLKESETLISNLDDNLDEYCSKLLTVEKTIESLEEEKKILAQNKKFKDAKRVKDTLVIKLEKKDDLTAKIEELKKTKVQSEESISENRKKVKKWIKKKEKEEISLREYEYNIL